MGIVYLLGTWHHLQTRDSGFNIPGSEIDAFESELRRLSAVFFFDAIVEELAPADDGGPQSPTIAESVAKMVGAHHERLDIGAEKRRELGIDASEAKICFEVVSGLATKETALQRIAQLHAARERIWVEKLSRLSARFKAVLFVLGGSHVESVNVKLRELNTIVRELHSCWGGRWDQFPTALIPSCATACSPGPT